MKKLFLSTVVFSVLVITGCQENSITDPIDQQDLQKNDDPLVHQGTITLNDLLLDPSVSIENYLTISGQIDYVHRIELVDPIPPAPQYYVSLSLSVNASLTSSTDSPNEPTMVVTSESEDIMYVSEDGIYLLEKSFPIRGRVEDDGMFLFCRFLVTTDGVGLNEMYLALPEGNSNYVSSRNDLGRDEVPNPPNIYPSKDVQISQ
jgi:hypothetical protein